jgi:hypothetical protein
LTDAQIDALLQHASATAQAHFGVRVAFQRAGEISVAELFQRLSPYQEKQAQAARFDFRHSTPQDRIGFADTFVRAMESMPYEYEELRAFAGGSLSRAPRDKDDLYRMLAEIQLAGLDEWAKAQAPDGRPLLDDSPYNEWAYWTILGRTALPWDVLITNQPIISAEWHSADVHSAMRGGLTNGTTDFNRNSSLGAFVYWSTFAFADRAPHTRSLRGGVDYDADEAARLAGIGLAHELGHLLFHYGHPLANHACVMSPIPLLRAREWAAGLSPKACPPGSEKAMQPGATIIPAAG